MTENILVPVTFSWPHRGSHVQLAGGFDPIYKPWVPVDMSKDDGSPDFKITLNLQPGKSYSYKFVIDGTWILDHDRPSHPDDHGNWNHVVVVEIPQPRPEGSLSSKLDSLASIYEQEKESQNVEYLI